MEKLVRGIHKFQTTHLNEHQEFFAQLSNGQSPETLLITCSDSRIMPGLLTQSNPGELFVLRNAGNIVPPYGASNGGEGATIEFAVAALNVGHIVLMGHSHCGAMKGLLHPADLKTLPRPFIPGMEAAGTVEAVGEGVTDVAVGDCVAYAMNAGAYAEYTVVPAWKLVKVPTGVSAEQAAAAMLQGMTAHYLVTSVYPLKAGETALIHAAAGGVGLLLIQMVKRLGARAIGTVSTAAKAELACAAGADEIILYTEQDFEAEARRLTNNKGVAVVYDSVGQDTFLKSLNCLAPRGMLALFGQSSGSVPPFDPGLLAQKGSLFLTRPSLAHYAATRAELLWRAGDLFNWINQGTLNLRIEQTFPLAEAAEAHRQLEGRKTTGKVVLIP